MKSRKIVRRDPRFAPDWPRTPWPGESRFREAMNNETLEPLAQRIDAVWGHPGLEDVERRTLLRAAHQVKRIDGGRILYDEGVHRAIEKLMAAFEGKYGVPDEDDDCDLI